MGKKQPADKLMGFIRFFSFFDFFGTASTDTAGTEFFSCLHNCYDVSRVKNVCQNHATECISQKQFFKWIGRR